MPLSSAKPRAIPSRIAILYGRYGNPPPLPFGRKRTRLSAIIALTITCSSSERVTVAWTAGDFQTVLESSIRQLRSDTGLTGVAAAVMTDGRFEGVAVSGERQRGTGIEVTVDDRWHAGSIAKYDDVYIDRDSGSRGAAVGSSRRCLICRPRSRWPTVGVPARCNTC